MKPKVSIIMNTYNEKPPFLLQAIESYLSQIGVDVQLIISSVEDDSNINLIMSAYGNKVDLVIMMKKDHPGRSPRGSFKQINNAFGVVEGDWFAFASSNDYASDDKCIREIDICEKKGKLICYSNFHHVDERSRIKLTTYFPPYKVEKHLDGNFVSDCSLVKTELIRKYMPFRSEELGNYAYWDLWLRIYKEEGDVFALGLKPTWFYRQLKNSMHIERKNDDEETKRYAQQRKDFINMHKKLLYGTV